MTSNFVIKLKAFFDLYFKSYQSQCFCIFSYYVINQYGYCVIIRIRYYQPSRISAKLSLILLKNFNEALKNKKLIRIALRGNKGFIPYTAQGAINKIKFQSEISRITSPAIDTSILAQFFSYMAEAHSFSKICFLVETKMVSKGSKRAPIKSNVKDPLLSSEKVQGLELSLHGRIPTEPVRPRKTVQTRILGWGNKRLVNRNPIQINRAESVNPALGSFSIWIRQVV